MSRRRDTLSFTHHAEVAALAEPEQDFWLRKADEHGWSVKRLRREVKASLQERATDKDREPGADQSREDEVTRAIDDTVLLRVPISADRFESCHAAASRLGLNVEIWAGQILLKAAAQGPDEQLQLDSLPSGGSAQDRAAARATPRVISVASAQAAGSHRTRVGEPERRIDPGPSGEPTTRQSI